MQQSAKERPILFSGPMVKAILEGRKTQTRRSVKSLCGHFDFYDYKKNDFYPYYFRRKDGVWDSFKTIDELATKYCPYGKAGDRLWVRETWVEADEDWHDDYCYQADGPNDRVKRWKSSIHMPRSASRITLEITNIRVERIQDISEEDAIAEGVPPFNWDDGMSLRPVAAFRKLWDSINSDRGYSWESNPWVWVVDFKRV